MRYPLTTNSPSITGLLLRMIIVQTADSRDQIMTARALIPGSHASMMFYQRHLTGSLLAIDLR